MLAADGLDGRDGGDGPGSQSLEIWCVARVAAGMLAALRSVHALAYAHNDIKMANMTIAFVDGDRGDRGEDAHRTHLMVRPLLIDWNSAAHLGGTRGPCVRRRPSRRRDVASLLTNCLGRVVARDLRAKLSVTQVSHKKRTMQMSCVALLALACSQRGVHLNRFDFPLGSFVSFCAKGCCRD